MAGLYESLKLFLHLNNSKSRPLVSWDKVLSIKNNSCIIKFTRLLQKQQPGFTDCLRKGNLMSIFCDILRKTFFNLKQEFIFETLWYFNSTLSLQVLGETIPLIVYHVTTPGKNRVKAVKNSWIILLQLIKPFWSESLRIVQPAASTV